MVRQARELETLAVSPYTEMPEAHIELLALVLKGAGVDLVKVAVGLHSVGAFYQRMAEIADSFK